LYNIRGVVLTVTATRDTGLLPWHADPVRVKCEELITEGLLIIASSGNTKDLTCNGPSASPSVLSVGGIIVPKGAGCQDSHPYHGCRGLTFEGKWVPEILAPAENIVLPLPFQSETEYLNHYTAPSDNLPSGYARTEGTSYSGPIILGAAACIWEARPSLTGFQIKSILTESSWTTKKIWDELRSGVVDVSAALKSIYSIKTECAENVEAPYIQLEKWKRKEETERLATLKGEDEQEVLAVLLSYIPEKASSQIMLYLRTMLQHPSDKIRAAAILLISDSCMTITSDELRQSLKDTSRYVRTGALYALGKYPDLWDELIDDLIGLFTDDDSNVRYCAIKLASTIKSPLFITPILSELRNDALVQNVSMFGVRCKFLEQITGMYIEPVPVFRDGQCWYSKASNESRLYIARKWEEWYRLSKL
jgi:serine protease AprX